MRKKLDKIADTVYITVPRLGVPPEHTFDTLCKAASHCSAIEDLNLSVGGGEYTDDRTPNDELVIDFKESMNIVKDVLLKQITHRLLLINILVEINSNLNSSFICLDHQLCGQTPHGIFDCPIIMRPSPMMQGCICQ